MFSEECEKGFGPIRCAVQCSEIARKNGTLLYFLFPD